MKQGKELNFNDQPLKLPRQDLDRPVDWSNLPDHLNDLTAAAAGVQVGQLYRTGSVLKVRIS